MKSARKLVNIYLCKSSDQWIWGIFAQNNNLYDTSQITKVNQLTNNPTKASKST